MSHSTEMQFNSLKDFVFAVYESEPCRICGLYADESRECVAIYAGYAKDNSSRVAHKSCWDQRGHEDQTTWAHP